MDRMNPTVRRYLPIYLAVTRSYLYAWESRVVLARPYAIYAAVTILAELLLLGVAGHRSNAADYALLAMEEVFALAFAVGVQRFVLLGETPSALRFFRFDRHFVQYLLLAILLVILAIFGAIPGLMVMGAPGHDAGFDAQGPAAAIATAITVMAAAAICRLTLTLPAAAVGDTLSTRAIWYASAGNSFRLLATMMLTVLPFLLIAGALLQFVPAPPPGSIPAPVTRAELVVTVMTGLISPVQTIVCNIMLSLCYDSLIRGGGPSA
jgi:hypothetical protein